MKIIYLLLFVLFLVNTIELPAEIHFYDDGDLVFAQENNDNSEIKASFKVWEKEKKGKRNLTTTFLGVSANYLIPMRRLSEVNDNALGYSFMLESRRYCNVWWGLRADYFSLDSLVRQNVPPNHFKSIFNLSPSIRYVFCGSNCEKSKVKPYLQGLLDFSSIRAVDEKMMLGIGASGGAGINFPFNLFGLCWAADLNALYSAPNCIYRAEGRENVQYLNLSFSISVGL